MNNNGQEHETGANHAWSFVAGLLMGGLVGAGVMLMLAPQSGKKTRAQIQRKITADVHEQAGALQQRGQDMFDEQRKRLSTVVEAGKTAVQGSRA
jgi:gas vesicle protein